MALHIEKLSKARLSFRSRVSGEGHLLLVAVLLTAVGIVTHKGAFSLSIGEAVALTGQATLNNAVAVLVQHSNRFQTIREARRRSLLGLNARGQHQSENDGNELHVLAFLAVQHTPFLGARLRSKISISHLRKSSINLKVSSVLYEYRSLADSKIERGITKVEPLNYTRLAFFVKLDQLSINFF